MPPRPSVFTIRDINGTPITPFTENRERIAMTHQGDPKFIEIHRHMFLHIATEESEAEIQHLLALHREKYRVLCQCLPRLAEAVTVSSVREEHILEGLGQSCRLDGGFSRVFCPELTLPFLQRGGGQGFLDLLRHFTLDDYSQIPKKPIYLDTVHWYPVDPAVLNANPELRTAFELADANFNVERSYLMSHTMHATMCIFLGLGDPNAPQPPRTEVSRGVAKSKLFGEVAEKIMGHVYGSAGKKEWKREQKEHKAVPIKKEEPGAQRFMCCRACTDKVGRKVYYCSRQCQRDDWKARHKQICGKAMTVKECEETANLLPKPEVSAAISKLVGPPEKGFKRLLNEFGGAGTDYILITRTMRRLRINIEDEGEKNAFRRFRELALSTGERRAVAALGQFLVKGPGGTYAKKFGGPHAALGGPVVQLGLDRQDAFDQLQREYEFDVKSAVEQLERKRGNDGMTEVEKEILLEYFRSW
ncbi:hypothetical protein R3P38DRAFT_2819103 [Favolaschia claudopus]|uniref:MYND-type domain-containing protein n=1 Tax=Favolaschia claudopus TaxID=2862362 RepID=A0AAW0ED44_9AGAR